MKSHKNIFLKGIFLSLLFLWPALVAAQPAQIVNKQVEEVLLAENWKKVADLLDNVTVHTPSPVLRLIKGHATLALNRNNESLCLFLSASSEYERKKWAEWTQDFAERNPRQAIAHYFRGDALAHFEKWDEAIAALNRALSIKPNHSLSLNARGVNYAAKRQWNEALADFDKAAKFNPGLADVYGNLGNLSLHQQDAVKGGIEAFEKALKISPDFALARYGLGCLNIVKGEFEVARKNIEMAEAKGGCTTELVAFNLAKMLRQIEAGVGKEMEIAKARGENPQMRVDSYMEQIKTKGAGWINGPLNRMVTEVGKYKDPKAEQYMNEQLGKVVQDPNISQSVKLSVMKQTGEISKWNKFVESIVLMRPQVLEMKQTIDTNIKLGGEVELGIFKGIAYGKAQMPTISYGNKVEMNIKPGQNNFLNDTREHGRMAQGLETYIQKVAPSLKTDAQGFKTSSEEAIIDSGDWPFNAIYGLCYETGS